MKFSIGLTGGIGAGKSTVLTIFKEKGYKVISADEICESIYDESNSNFHSEIRDRWGTKYFSDRGELNKKLIAEKVFTDRKALNWLNSKLHPEILRRAIIQAESVDGEYVFEVPLLFEVAWEFFFDKIIVIYASNKLRIERLLKRGMTIDEIKRRINAQMPQDEKIEKADYVLINNGNLKFLRQQVFSLNINS